MKFSPTFKIIFGFLLVLLIAVISGIYHIDFNKYLKSANEAIVSDNDKLKKIKVELVNCIDGDTARFKENGNIYTYRFLGINTPEVNPVVERYGKDASNYTCKKLKSAKNIYVSYEKTSIKTDKYQRHLVWVYVDDNLLQELLIENGYAYVEYVYTNLTYLDQLYKSEKKVIESKINLYNEYKVKNYKNKKYIVLFKNVKVLDEIEVNNGSRVDIIANPESKNKKFVGWTLDGELYDLSKPITQDMILEASFE